MLSKETYELVDKIKQKFPNQFIELRCIKDKVHLYINNKEQYWCSGSNEHIDKAMGNILWGILVGIAMYNKDQSLKNKLGQL